MPWSASDAHAKNHSIKSGSKKSRQWSDVANSVLKRTGNEGLAIREANGVAKRAEGGGVGDDYNTQLSPSDEAMFQVWKSQNAPHDSGADYDLRGAYQSGLQPSAANGHWPDTYKKPNHPTFSDQSVYAKSNPGMAGYWINNQQFVPPANYRSGGIIPHMADGGIGLANMEDPARLNPSFIRQQAQPQGNPFTHGMLNSPVPGRTDQLPITVMGGSHVIPADVIAGLGQGNSLAGSNVFEHILKTGPWATQDMQMHHGSGPPKAPAPFYNPLHYQAPHQKKGGDVHKPTKIIAAGGEWVVPKDMVVAIGAGDENRGHKFLDNFIKKVRVHTAHTMLALPGPKK